MEKKKNFIKIVIEWNISKINQGILSLNKCNPSLKDITMQVYGIITLDCIERPNLIQKPL